MNGQVLTYATASSESFTINPNAHINVDVPISLPAGTSISGVSVLTTPNGAWVFAQIVGTSSTKIVVGLMNTHSSAITGKVSVQYFYR